MHALSLDIPEDLRIIVNTCIQKDSAKCYQSAEALAEDLDRFLKGEPIKARPSHWTYLAGKWMHRDSRFHLGAGLQSEGADASGPGGWSTWSVCRKAVLAEEFSHEADLVVGQLQLAFMAPTHDIWPQRWCARERIVALQARRAKEGSLAVAPSSAAIG